LLFFVCQLFLGDGEFETMLLESSLVLITISFYQQRKSDQELAISSAEPTAIGN
jgi:hypothetical protein